MRRTTVVLLALAVGAGLAAADRRRANRPPSEIVRHEAAADSLEARLAWALDRAPKAGSGRIFWVGYCIDRLQGEHSRIGSFTSDGRLDLTIAEVLAGKSAAASTTGAGDDVRRAAAAALDEIEERGKAEKKVLKELGFFLKYETGGPPALAGLHLSHLDMAFDFEGAALLWLGQAPEEQSLAVIKKLFGSAQGEDLREHLVAAAGCHGTPALVVPFLAGVLDGDGPDGLRKAAAFWLGQQNDAEGLSLLVRAAKSDRSEEVRDGAVFAISQVELPSAVDEIIALARGAGNRNVRKKAVFWLGQMASKKSAPALVEFARKDADAEVQEQAVFALSQLPDNQGVDALIKLAKTHPDPRVRKKAVFWLGECDDPRALEVLVSIVKGK